MAQRCSPLIFRLEDLQWADPSTLDFLQHLCTKFSNFPLIVLATYRTEDLGTRHLLHRLLQHGNRLGCLSEFRLNGFSSIEIQQLLAELSIAPSDVESLTSRLYAGTQGNPFLLVSQLQAMQEEGLMRMEEEKSCRVISQRMPTISQRATEVIRHRI